MRRPTEPIPADRAELIAEIRETLGGRGAQQRLALYCGVTPQAVRRWFATGLIPLERVGAVSRLLGIPPRRLRPDIDWPAAESFHTTTTTRRAINDH